MEPQKRLLTLKEVASELRCSKATYRTSSMAASAASPGSPTSQSAGESWFAANGWIVGWKKTRSSASLVPRPESVALDAEP